MVERRTIGGVPHRLLGVFPRPVAQSFAVLLKERGIPVQLEDLYPLARPYGGLEPLGDAVYLWVPERLFLEAEEVLSGGDAGA